MRLGTNQHEPAGFIASANGISGRYTGQAATNDDIGYMLHNAPPCELRLALHYLVFIIVFSIRVVYDGTLYYHDTVLKKSLSVLMATRAIRECAMVRDNHTWQATTAQFYGQLYVCVWQNLEPFLGASTSRELILLSGQALHEAYPFLARLVWSAQGLD